MPLSGLVPLFNIETGEVIFGGVGAGLYGILLYAIVAVFIAGLMVGGTPEYVGKKIEQKEVKMAMLALIATAFSILIFTAISIIIPFAAPTKGSHGQQVAQAIGILRARRPLTLGIPAHTASVKRFTPSAALLGTMAAHSLALTQILLTTTSRWVSQC